MKFNARVWIIALIVALSLEASQATLSVNAAGLPVPTGITVFQDDRNAILQWDFDPSKPMDPLPENVVGYKITWGPASNPSAFSKVTEERIIQLQPLVNGQPYVAQIQSVDSLGQVSSLSSTVQFTGDPTRVDGLRSKMNGFFDDFNLPQGLPDERKWNTAYSRCNGDWSNGFFINDQFHAHNTTFSDNCDRAQSISRPRAELDFSDNGTRTIVFDFDGEFRRNQWYLDIVPRLMDISGQVNIEGVVSPADPANGLRFHQNEQTASIFNFGTDGSETALSRTNFQPLPPLDYAGVKQVSNVRRRWEIHISRTYAEVLIDGKKVLATQPGAFNLTQNRYTLLWNTFAYNASKSNVPFVLTHWDNFGFDAPAGTTRTTVTHNYRLYNTGTDFIKPLNLTTPAVKQLYIPDPITGATAQRLMFTLQMNPNDWYEWSPNDSVSINGVKIAIPKPVSNSQPELPMTILISSIAPYTVVLPIANGVFRQGQNEISFSTVNSSMHNIHAEFDFNTANEPAYTPPAQALNSPAQPKIPAVGPNAVISQINTTKVDTWRDDLNNPAAFNVAVSGTVPVTVQVHNDIAMQATGSNLGVQLVDLLIDGQIVISKRTSTNTPAPAVITTFNLNTVGLSNGMHEIYVRAYDTRCTPSIADYGGTGSESGHYFAMHINVQNAAARQVPDPAAAVEVQAINPAAQNYSIKLPLIIKSGLTNTACASLAASTTPLNTGSLASPAFVSPRDIRRDEQFFLCD